MRLVECSLSEHGGAILQIMNEAIVNSTALYDYEPRVPSSMVPWFEAKRAKSFPVWGAVDDAGGLIGFASYGTFRAWPAYKYSVEHSVYVAPGQQGQGVGTLLMQRLVKSATEQQLHALIGGIDASNASSVAFHRRGSSVGRGRHRAAAALISPLSSGSTTTKAITAPTTAGKYTYAFMMNRGNAEDYSFNACVREVEVVNLPSNTSFDPPGGTVPNYLYDVFAQLVRDGQPLGEPSVYSHLGWA